MKVNALINAKIESKKLKFGPKKCFKIHIGSSNRECLTQKVHSADINEAEYETYLGDIVSSDGSNDRNIANRYNKGVGAISQMDTMLNRTSLGHFYFEIGLVMRDTMLVSKLVYNSEVWYNVSHDQLSKLEQIDEMWLRKLFSLAKSAPKEGLYMECGKMPIRFVVMMRRILYLWNILHRDEDELVNRFLSAQQIWTSKKDWIQQVKKNIKEINVDLTDNQIMAMSYEAFKKKSKSKLRYMQPIT